MVNIEYDIDEAIIMTDDQIYSWEQYEEEDKYIEKVVLTTKNIYIQWVEEKRFHRDNRWAEKYLLKDIKCVEGLQFPVTKISMGARYYLQFVCYNQRVILGFYGDVLECEKKVVQWANAINFQIVGSNCPQIDLDERPDKHPIISFIKKKKEQYEKTNVKGESVCPECGKICENNSEYCTSCGTIINLTQWKGDANQQKIKPREEKCPSCSAPLRINGSEAQVVCEYCGTQVVVDEKALHISRVISAQKKAKETQDNNGAHKNIQNIKIQPKELNNKVIEPIKAKAVGTIDSHKNQLITVGKVLIVALIAAGVLFCVSMIWLMIIIL